MFILRVETYNDLNPLNEILFICLFVYLFICERGEGSEKERERNIDVWEVHWSVPLTAPQLGTWPTAQACDLTGNQTSNLSVHGLSLNPLNHTIQDIEWNLVDAE